MVFLIHPFRNTHTPRWSPATRSDLGFRNSLSLRTPHQKLHLSAILAKRIIFFKMGSDTKSMMNDNLTTRRDTTAINLSRADQ